MRVLKVTRDNPEPEAIREAAAAVLSGGLVVFPTETLYGLAANALDVSAVLKVFEAKMRPSSAPLPVQVADRSQIGRVGVDLSDAALRLAEQFMPGPVTLVVPRNPAIPPIVTAGGDTIAVRVPDHPVALAFLREAGVPVAATSANVSGSPGPRDAEEAVRHIGQWVDVVLDAGPARLGMPSTVIDTTVSPPRLLRAGALSVPEIKKVVGDLVEA